MGITLNGGTLIDRCERYPAESRADLRWLKRSEARELDAAHGSTSRRFAQASCWRLPARHRLAVLSTGLVRPPAENAAMAKE
jgi:hypothetical protein